MIEGRFSRTAVATAFVRALHVAANDAPYVFEDRAAASYLPIDQQRYIRWLSGVVKRWRSISSRRYYTVANVGSQILVRARYAEDALAAAVGRGCERYVILGAGLDTYAERHVGDSAPLPVVEIDHPATQEWKCAKLLEHAPTLPPAATYRSLDLKRWRSRTRWTISNHSSSYRGLGPLTI